MALSLHLLSLVASASAFAIREATDVACGYGDACWPTTAQFAALNTSLSGKVKYVHPIATVCHDAFGEYNAASCATLQANWDINQYTSNYLGGYPAHAWSDGYGDDYCAVDNAETDPCGQGRVPPVFVDAESAADIQTALAFVRQYNLRVRVKSTGHSLTGGSGAKGAFGISVHKLKSITFTSNFNGKGPAVTVGAGVQFYELYQAADAANRVVVGGGCDSVSVSGYTLGGGHSRYSPSLGLSVDQVLEFTIITADGTLRTVNSATNTDLWYAIRGGGAGFGIVTSWTLKTYPPVTNEYVNNFSILAPSAELYRQAIYQFLKLEPTLRAQRWSDLAITSKSGLYLIGAAFKPNVTSEAAESALWDPIRTWATANGVTFNTTFTSYSSQYETSTTEPFANQHEVLLGPEKMVSRLIPATTLTNVSRLNSTATFLAGLDSVNFLNVPGGAVTNAPSSPMALNPAWRTAISHVAWYATWSEGSTKAVQQAAREVATTQLITLTDIIQSDAAYINESDPDDQSWPHNYFGDNYNTLLNIKKTYDPHHYFTCTGCVGSEVAAGQDF